MAEIEEHDDKRRRKHRRRRHSTSNETGNNDDSQLPPSDAFNRPNDIQALRDARLKSLQTPAAERKKMKIEYVYEKPVRKPPEVEKIPRRSSSIFGIGSSGPSKTKTKTDRKDSSQSAKRPSDDDDQYVYRSSGVQSADVQEEALDNGGKADKQSKTTGISRRATQTPDTAMSKMQRRKTEPSLRKSSSVVSRARPPLRKSTTALSSIKAGSVRPPPVRAATEVSSAKPSKPGKKNSVFGTFLAGSPPQPERKVACLTCGADDIPVSKSAKLPCTHRMCHSCLERIFRMSITDPAHMPPRCCTDRHISLSHVERLFDDNFKKTWNRKFKEYNAKNRIYCPRRGCSEWIQPKHMFMERGKKIGKCPKCKLEVCTMCNMKAHRSKDCPQDPDVQKFAEVIKEKGWQKCYNCSATVELKEGCNHMTCRCTAEFCMVCGLKWKSCDCPWFNYEAVDEHLGNPIRYQEELDRRRDQERRDAEFARRLQRLGIRENNNRFGVGNAAGHQINENFAQQAREALTANYQNAEQAARNLLNGYFVGHGNPPHPFPFPLAPEGDAQQVRRFGQAPDPAGNEPRAGIRRQGTRTNNIRNNENRRIRDWANGVDTGI